MSQPGIHQHEFHRQNDLAERGTRAAMWITLATVVLAIVALLGGWIWGWVWLDPVMGMVGAVLVAIWAKGLIVETSRVLLDREMDHPVVEEIREVIGTLPGTGQTRLTDLHVWRVAHDAYACAMTVVFGDRMLTAAGIRSALSIHAELVHCTIEVHHHDVPAAGENAAPA